MRILIIIGTFFIFSSSLIGQEVSILSWNIKHLGKSKNDNEIAFIAEVLRDFDIVAIQEVVAIDPGGAKAVARLVSELNRKGARWDYKVSIPTQSPGKKTERYAYLWKSNKAKLIGQPWLDRNFEPVIFREPYLARFQVGQDTLLMVNYHARKHDDKPHEEIIFFYQYPSMYPDDQLLIAGDFNTYTDHDVFRFLEEVDLIPNMKDQATTLKRKCGEQGEHLLHPIDFLLYEHKEIEILETGIIDFVRDCIYLKAANQISDHVPVWAKLKL